MTKTECLDHLTKCATCLHFASLCMVSPFRGYPTLEDRQLNDAERIVQKISFWKENKEQLMKCGVNYDPSKERIISK